MRNQRGITLLEMAITLVLTGIVVTIFAHQVIGISSLTANARMDTQSNELRADLRMYLRQQNSVRRMVASLVGSGGIVGDKGKKCLKGEGANCKTLSAAAWKLVDNKVFTLEASGKTDSGHLHEYYGLNGPCSAKDAYACPWRVSVHSRWVCEKNTQCSGLEFVGQIIAREDQKELIKYRFTKFWNAYDLGFAPDIDYNRCGSVKDGKFEGKDPIEGVNYNAREIKCGTLPDKVVCSADPLLPILGAVAGNECGVEDSVPSAGVCTLAFNPGAFSTGGAKDEFKMDYSTQGANISRLNMRCEENWVPDPGYTGPGQEGNSAYNSQVAYLPQEEEASGQLGVLQQEILPGRTEIRCTAVMLKQDQSEAGDCYASIIVNKPLSGGPPTFEPGSPREGGSDRGLAGEADQ